MKKLLLAISVLLTGCVVPPADKVEERMDNKSYVAIREAQEQEAERQEAATKDSPRHD